MKSALSIIIIISTLAMLAAPSPLAAQKKPDAKKTAGTVTVYYFHGVRRCATCLAIEDVTKNVVKDKYVGNKRVIFKTVDFEAEANQALAEKYEVAGSSLIVAAGGNHEDLTAEAFQYARSDPGKLQSLLVKTVDKALK